MLQLPLINERTQCQPIILKCFACLIQCEDGQRKCDNDDLIMQLYNILSVLTRAEKMPSLETQSANAHPDTMALEYTVMALHNCLISKRSRWRARELWDFPILLIENAHSKTNPKLQMHCLQVSLLFILFFALIKKILRTGPLPHN